MTATGERVDRRSRFVATLGGMASYLDGATIISVAFAIVMLQHDLALDAWAIGGITAALTFSFAAGAIVGGRLGDVVGRRRIYSIDLLVYAAGVLVMILAPNAAVLFAGVIVTGLAMGADIPTSLALVFEESRTGQRGRAVAYSQTLWLTGVLISQGIAFLFADLGGLGGKLLFVHLFVVAVVVWALRRGIRESVTWEAIRKTPPAERSRAFGALFRPPYLWGLIATALVFTLTATIPNTLGQFNFYLLVNVAGAPERFSTAMGFLSLALGVATAYLFQRVVDGKRRMLWFTLGIVALTAGPLVAILGGFSVAAIVFAGLANSIGANFAGEAVYKVWTQEIFPTSVRSTAQGLTYGVARFVLAALSYFTPVLAATSPVPLMVFLVVVAPIAGVIGIVWVARLPKAGSRELEGGDDPAPVAGNTAAPSVAE